MAAERDLAGFDDCDPQFTEIAADTDEHVRHSAYWAISTQRGQDWEEPGRWSDLRDALEQRSINSAAGDAQNVGTDLEETDARVQRAVYRVVAGEVVQWYATIFTRAGTVTAEGPLQPLTIEEPETEDPAPAGPVEEGAKSIRQIAVDGGLFPFWILGPNSGRIVYSIGLLLDMATEWLVLGIQQRLPLRCDEGALPWLARDLGIPRGFRESSDAYRRRLARWIPTWKRAGITFAIAEQIQAYCWPQVPRVHVIQHDPGAGGKPTRATWNTRHPDGSETVTIVSPSNWDFDSTHPSRPVSLDTRDPRLFVLLEQPDENDPTDLFLPRSSAQAVTRDLTAMNGAIRPDGSGAPADQYADLVRIAQTFRASGSYISWIGVAFLYPVDPEGTGAQYPDGSWWDPLNDAKDGNRIPSRIIQLYIDLFPGNRLPESPVPYP